MPLFGLCSRVDHIHTWGAKQTHMREAKAYLMGWVLPQDSTQISYSPIQFNKETKSPANDAQLAKRVPSPSNPTIIPLPVRLST